MGTDTTSEPDPAGYWDTLLPNISAQSVAEVLAAFPLQLAGGKDFEWLALAVRRSLAFSMPNDDENPSRKSNAKVRKELGLASAKATKLQSLLFDRISPEAEHAISRQAFGPRFEDDGFEGTEAEEGLARFYAIVRELGWLSSYLDRTESQLPPQRPRWTEREMRQIRVSRGLCLAPIFMSAFKFDTLPTKSFGDFYQCITSLAFNETDIPDFEALISEIRSEAIRRPINFPAHIIPNL